MIKSILSFALSRGGVIVRWIVGYIIAACASNHLIPNEDLPAIKASLESGGIALLAIAYAALQLWFHKKQTESSKDLQTAINDSRPYLPPIKVDGYIGNETIVAFTDRTGIPVRRAKRP